MAYVIPTTKEIVDKNIANFESKLNQDTPPVDIAFTNTLSVIEGENTTGLYKYAADRAMANLAITAGEEDLENIGKEYDVIRKPAEAAVLTISLPATNGTVIPATVLYTGNDNGVIYKPDSEATAANDEAIQTVTAEDVGVVGNLDVGRPMTISYQIAGAETEATITVVDNIGADKEDLEVYRQRVLLAERGSTGGSNVTDHKIWSTDPAGVARTFPYSGKPFESIEDSYPGDRTVYVEATEDVDPDGIAPQPLLDEVREALKTDPETGFSRPALGLEDSNLYVESIARFGFYVQVVGIDVTPDALSDAQGDVETALTLYFKSVAPFVEGVDIADDRKDKITDTTVSQVVQDALGSYGGSAESVNFGTAPGVFTTSFLLEPGNLAKLIIPVTYVS